MSNLWLNWRFGSWHLQIGPDRPFISWHKNQFHVENPPDTWFEAY